MPRCLCPSAGEGAGTGPGQRPSTPGEGGKVPCWLQAGFVPNALH